MNVPLVQPSIKDRSCQINKRGEVFFLLSGILLSPLSQLCQDCWLDYGFYSPKNGKIRKKTTDLQRKLLIEGLKP